MPEYSNICSQQDFDNRKTNINLRILCSIRIRRYEDIDGAGTWDTSGCTDMSYMFYMRSSQIPDTIGNWDTSNVSYMKNMFCLCIADIPNTIEKWDTGNCTDMSSMFCYSRTDEIPDIGKCINMSMMFLEYKGKFHTPQAMHQN